MSFTKLRVINKTSLETYSELQVLDLSSTQLKHINDSAFNYLKRLNYLNLSNNEQLPMTQKTVNSDLFSTLTSLTELKIYGNTATYNLDGYPDKALSRLRNLNSLWIDGLTNASFGPAFRDMKNLKTIRIPGDIIQPPWRFCETNIRDEMLDNLVHITSFTMRKCGVECVGINAFKNMTNLEYLDLSFNRFLTIEGMSKALPSLANTKLAVLKLNAIENVLQLTCGPTITRTIAKRFSGIISLKELHVEYNAINGFERNAIAFLPKSLEYINAKRNELELGFYAFDVFLLENLSKLDVSYNFFPDDSEIWHHSPPSVSYQLSEMKCVNFHVGAEQNVKSENAIPVGGETFQNNANFSSALPYSMSRDSKLENLDNLNKNPEKNLIEILKATPTGGTPNLGQHVTELIHSSFRMGQQVLKPEEREGTVCPRTKPYIPPGTVVAYLPAKLEVVDISHSKLAHPIPELYFNESNSVRMVNASNSLLYCWDGPIHGLTKLEYVDLSSNLCSKMRFTFFDKVPRLKYLSISKNMLFVPIQSDKQGRILQNLKELEELDMSLNRLQKIPQRFFKSQTFLRQLNLSKNMIEHFSVDVSHMVQLETLDMSDNFMHTISQEVRKNLTLISERNYKNTKKTLYVNLNDNRFHCYCNNLEFLQWVYDHMSTCRFLDVSISQCEYYNLTAIEIRNREHFRGVLDHLESHCKSYTGVVIGASVALCILLNIIIGVLVHRFRWKLRYWYYVTPTKMTRRGGYISIDSLSTYNSRFKYDIYVASVDDDRNFVMGEMKSRLENENLRLFIQEYDVVPGQNIYSIITNAIHVTRVVIFIISKGCEKDKEWQIAMRMAHEESIKRGQPMFFGIFIDHEPATPYSSDIREIRQRCYVDYPGNSQPATEQTFWVEIIEKITETGNTEILTIDLGIQ